MFDFDDLEDAEETTDRWDLEPVPATGQETLSQAALAVHEDAGEAVRSVAARSVDKMLWQTGPDVARALAFFGPGAVVLPLLGRASGVKKGQCWSYRAHPEVADGGMMDAAVMHVKFGHTDPQGLAEEITGGSAWLHSRLQNLSDDQLRGEVASLRDWCPRAAGRVRTLERRVAWTLLGIPCSLEDPAEVRRAFKRKALELHPDKGGDEESFKLLQEMKDALVDLASPAAQEAATEGTLFQRREALAAELHDRENLEGARLGLHRSIMETWERVNKLADEIRKAQESGGAQDCLRHLRSFIDNFTRLEIARLKKHSSPGAAEQTFRRFIERGSEVICMAGSQDPSSTSETLQAWVIEPLLAAAEPAEAQALRGRASALLEAIGALPALFAACSESDWQAPAVVSEEDTVVAERQVLEQDTETPPSTTVRENGSCQGPTGGDASDSTFRREPPGEAQADGELDKVPVSSGTLDPRTPEPVPTGPDADFEVVSKVLVVRSAPSTKSTARGTLRCGDLLRGRPHEVAGEPWLLLKEASQTRWRLGASGEAWALIHGRSLGLGKLLQEVLVQQAQEFSGRAGADTGVVKLQSSSRHMQSVVAREEGVATMVTAEAFSGRAIQVLNGVPGVGARCHYDRRYTFTSLGDFARPGMLYVLTSNDDKGTPSAEAMWRLTLAAPGSIYLNFRSEGHVTQTGADAWLKRGGWKRSSLRSSVSTGFPNGPYSGPVYSRRAAAGEKLDLMGSNCPEGTYFVFVHVRPGYGQRSSAVAKPSRLFVDES